MTPDELREKADIVSIVGMYVKLNKRGTSWWGQCPFHREKTESFHVVTDRRFWKCFGCGATGSVYDFIMRMEGLDFKNSMRRVAALSGITLEPSGKPLTPEEIRQDRERREEARSLMAEAEHWRQITKPPKLCIYGHPASNPEILGAYVHACGEDPGFRAWVRADMLHAKKVTWCIVDLLARKHEKEMAEVVEW